MFKILKLVESIIVIIRGQLPFKGDFAYFVYYNYTDKSLVSK